MIRLKMNIFISLCCVILGIGAFGDSGRSSNAGEAMAAEQASKQKAEPDPFAYTPPSRACTRATLIQATESYIAAQKAGDLTKMALASDAKFKENMSAVAKDKGLWNTPLPIAFHRSIYDVPRCKTFTEVIVTEGRHPYVLGTRLTVDKGKVTEIDSLVTDKDDWLFDAEVYLKYSKAEEWPVIHVDDRVSRQDLVDAGNQYFDFIFLDKGIRAPWGTPCARLEGGIYTNQKNENRDTCQIPAPLGEMFVEDRTFVVDEELGAVNVFCRFGDSTEGMPDSHTFVLKNGRYRWIHTLSVNLTGKTVDVPKYAPEPDCECNREMLMAATKSYITAQKAGDLSKMALADKVRFRENMSEIDKGKGLWNTPLPIAHHLSIYDTGRCKTFTEAIVTEGGHKYVIGTRLKVDKGKVKEIDSLVTDNDDWLFNADNYLKYSKAEDWSMLAPDDRPGRQELIDAGHQYFDFIFMDKHIRLPFGGVPCSRLEGGAYTNPDNLEKDKCWVPNPLGELPITNRTFVVDEQMGCVNVFCRFGNSKNGMPDSHLFRLINGKYRLVHTLSVNLTGKPPVYPKNPPPGVTID
ncbi:MAG: hypothetical protein JXA73_11965 [Acidobacteria bacterium]|nr:hypothetical protein [Acidobacteriota bacterium]